MSNNLKSIWAVGDEGYLRLTDIKTGEVIVIDMLNDVSMSLKNESLYSKNRNSNSIAFAKAGTGEMMCKCEDTSDYIAHKVNGLSLVRAGADNGVVRPKDVKVKLLTGGVTPVIDEYVTGTLYVENALGVALKSVSTVPVLGEYKYDSGAKTITVGGGLIGEVIAVFGDVKSPTSKSMGFQSKPVLPVFKGDLVRFKTYADGTVVEENIRIPKIATKRDLKIELGEKVSAQDFGFEILLGEGETDLAYFISEDLGVTP